MADPAILYFLVLTVFLFDDHIGVYLLCGSETFSLNDFQIDSNFAPVFIQELVSRIFGGLEVP